MKPAANRLGSRMIRDIVRDEIVRGAIRTQLQAPTKPHGPRLKLWAFLNSAFGIFVLSSILVSGLSAALTYAQSRAQESKNQAAQVRRLLAEFDFRLNEIDVRAARIRNTDSRTEKGQQTMYVWRAARGNSDYQPALPEFRNVHWAGIIIQLDGFGVAGNAALAVAATWDLENGRTVAAEDGYYLFPPNFLEQKARTLRAYREQAWNSFQDKWNRN